MNIKNILIIAFSLFASCNAELQSSKYGYSDPLNLEGGRSIFWEYIDARASGNAELFFETELDKAESRSEKLKIIAVFLNLTAQNLCDIHIYDLLKNKYGKEEGKKLYDEALEIYNDYIS